MHCTYISAQGGVDKVARTRIMPFLFFQIPTPLQTISQPFLRDAIIAERGKRLICSGPKQIAPTDIDIREKAVQGMCFL